MCALATHCLTVEVQAVLCRLILDSSHASLLVKTGYNYSSVADYEAVGLGGEGVLAPTHREMLIYLLCRLRAVYNVVVYLHTLFLLLIIQTFT